MSGFEMFLVRKTTAVILFFMTLISSITGVGTIMEKPADLMAHLPARTLLAEALFPQEKAKSLWVFSIFSGKVSTEAHG